ncbi:maltokinase N-terminal cap-like domain-containing protein [Nocardioides flavescens]|uniref:Maltokinase N-terminal cap domain-containing protein n=1 Tax=Nocardioides flavescens TaxID=2691959 RepID=A0A6L7F134_9ACTN|nr:hypothetical protein [Nocardioides flavescens]
MALLHPRAQLVPSKQELIDGWLPTRGWWDGVSRTTRAAFRFDDPAGEVGLEGFVLGAGPEVPDLFVPLSYRAEPLEDAEEHLVGTTEHSVLGTRWVYDACADPVFAQVLARVVLTGDRGGDREFTDESGAHRVEPTSAQVRGDGSAETTPEVTEARPYDEGPVTVVDAGALQLVVARVLGEAPVAAQHLHATWDGGSAVLAGVR